MKLNVSQAIRKSLILFLLLALSGCVVYSRSSDPTRIRSTNSAIVLTPEPAEGRNISNVNGRIVVGTGMAVNDVDTVNGRITVEDGATARNIETVNGRVTIGGRNASVNDVETVNGRITAVNGGQIHGSAEAVNGRISLTNVTVGRSVKTSNGDIQLFESSVGQNVETRNGDIRLENSVIENDLIIQRRRIAGIWGLFDWDWNRQEVVIGPGSEIRGTLLARDEITLYVHESASVNNIVGATPQSYNRMRP